MKQLRPHLTDEQVFVEQVQRQLTEGYHLAYCQDRGEVKTLARFRFLEFLAWGKVLYIDDFMKAMIYDVNRIAADLEHDTRNVLLAFARIWSTLETDTIRSKPAAADWVINRLPERHQTVMKRAKSICIGLENEHWG